MSFQCACGKVYQNSSSLSRHGKKCQTYQDRKRDKLALNVFEHHNIGLAKRLHVTTNVTSPRNDVPDEISEINLEKVNDLPRDLVSKILGYMPLWVRSQQYQFSVCKIELHYYTKNGIKNGGKYVCFEKLNNVQISQLFLSHAEKSKYRSIYFRIVELREFLYHYMDTDGKKVIWFSTKFDRYDHCVSLLDDCCLLSCLEVYNVIKDVFYVENIKKCGDLTNDFGYSQDRKLESVRLEDMVLIVRLPHKKCSKHISGLINRLQITY